MEFISSALADTDTITVQDTDLAPVAPPAVESGWTSLIPMVLIFVVFYFLLIRPQEKKRKAQESLVSGVKVGEKVLTNSGFFGVITKINESDDTIMLQISKDVEVKMLKSAISNITSREKAAAIEKKSKDKDANPKKSKSKKK